MTMLASERVKCGHCGASSDQTILMSTSSFGSPDLDLRPAPMQRFTMNTWLQICPTCGYCSPKIQKAPRDASVLKSDAYRAALRRKDFPELARRFLAFAVLKEQSNPEVVAQAYLQAAWVCDDDGRAEQATESRRIAAEWFRRGKPLADDEEGMGAGAVFVDVLRRGGQFAEASAQCAELLASPAASGMIREVLEYQQQLIASSNTAAHRVSDLEKKA